MANGEIREISKLPFFPSLKHTSSNRKQIRPDTLGEASINQTLLTSGKEPGGGPSLRPSPRELQSPHVAVGLTPSRWGSLSVCSSWTPVAPSL